jgi:hypothetical protein
MVGNQYPKASFLKAAHQLLELLDHDRINSSEWLVEQ